MTTIEPGQRWSKIDTSGETQRFVVGVPTFYPYSGGHYVCYIQTRVSGSGYVSSPSDIQIASHEWFRKWTRDANCITQSKAQAPPLQSQSPIGRLELAPQKSVPK